MKSYTLRPDSFTLNVNVTLSGTIIHGSLKSSHLFFQHNHTAELRKRTPTKAAVAIDFSYVKT